MIIMVNIMIIIIVFIVTFIYYYYYDKHKMYSLNIIKTIHFNMHLEMYVHFNVWKSHNSTMILTTAKYYLFQNPDNPNSHLPC